MGKPYLKVGGIEFENARSVDVLRKRNNIQGVVNILKEQIVLLESLKNRIKQSEEDPKDSADVLRTVSSNLKEQSLQLEKQIKEEFS